MSQEDKSLLCKPQVQAAIPDRSKIEEVQAAITLCPLLQIDPECLNHVPEGRPLPSNEPRLGPMKLNILICNGIAELIDKIGELQPESSRYFEDCTYVVSVDFEDPQSRQTMTTIVTNMIIKKNEDDKWKVFLRNSSVQANLEVDAKRLSELKGQNLGLTEE